MSGNERFGFICLEEEDDDDIAADIGHSILDVDCQPYVFTNCTDEDSDQPQAGSHSECGGSVQGSDNPSLQLGQEYNFVKENSANHKVGNDILPCLIPDQKSSDLRGYNGISGIQSTVTGNESPIVPQSSIQIHYNNAEGKVNVMQGQVVFRPDGTQFINTHVVPERWSEMERPLRQRKICFLKAFSIAAIVMFFPFGIPAAFYAFNIEQKFSKGIIQGNIDTALKYARRSERLIVVSFVMSIVLVILIISVIVRPSHTSKYEQRGTILG